MQRYYSYNEYLKSVFGRKVYKLSLSLSNLCPNRDGKVGYGGCIFCAGGSGEFAADFNKSITEQICEAKQRVLNKSGDAFIAYFQSFTSTYVSAEKLSRAINEALCDPQIVGVSVATRADCLDDDIMSVLKETALKTHLTVELGLQTSNEKTAELINRCCPNKVYESAVKKLKQIRAHTVLHIIFGLPFETEDDMLCSVRYAVKIGADGVKLQLLHVLEGTPLAQMYKNGEFETLCAEKYYELVAKALELLPPNVVVHRLTGDAPKRLLISPLWSADKKRVINDLAKYLNHNDIVQGKKAK